MKKLLLNTKTLLVFLLAGATASAAPVTNVLDARVWQGADIGTFTALYYGSDTPANRAQLVADGLLDDGLFTFAGATAASLMATPWSTGGVSTGYSYGVGAGDYSYGTPYLGYGFAEASAAANGIDNLWIQTSGTIGESVWDLGAASTKAAIFNTIDHGPLPYEAIESTVYLSNDLVNWTQAVVEKVWLEGFMPNTLVEWDGFAYAVGTGTNATFRYASIIWGGPGGLQADGDNEINGVVGLNSDFTASNAPDAGSTFCLMVFSLAGLVGLRRRIGRS